MCSRAEYIRGLTDEELAMYLYLNKSHTGLGLKRLTAWLSEEEYKEEDLCPHNKRRDDCPDCRH